MASMTSSLECHYPDGFDELWFQDSSITQQRCGDSLVSESKSSKPNSSCLSLFFQTLINGVLLYKLNITFSFSSTTQTPGLSLAFLLLVSTSQSTVESCGINNSCIYPVSLFIMFSITAPTRHAFSGGVFFSILFLPQSYI